MNPDQPRYTSHTKPKLPKHQTMINIYLDKWIRVFALYASREPQFVHQKQVYNVWIT